MTTKFDSKDDAKAVACTYMGVTIDALNGIIPKNSEMYNPLDFKREYPEEIEIYTIKNKDGKDVSFAIGKFRSGYDLWLMSENGMSVRV